jgi:hypothetical protein
MFIRLREALPRSAHGKPHAIVTDPQATAAGRCSAHFYTRILWV